MWCFKARLWTKEGGRTGEEGPWWKFNEGVEEALTFWGVGILFPSPPLWGPARWRPENARFLSSRGGVWIRSWGEAAGLGQASPSTLVSPGVAAAAETRGATTQRSWDKKEDWSFCCFKEDGSRPCHDCWSKSLQRMFYVPSPPPLQAIGTEVPLLLVMLRPSSKSPCKLERHPPARIPQQLPGARGPDSPFNLFSRQLSPRSWPSLWELLSASLYRGQIEA